MGYRNDPPLVFVAPTPPPANPNADINAIPLGNVIDKQLGDLVFARVPLRKRLRIPPTSRNTIITQTAVLINKFPAVWMGC